MASFEATSYPSPTSCGHPLVTSSKSYTVLPGYCGWVFGICVCVLIECGFHCSEFSLVHPWCCFGCWYWFVCLMPVASYSVCVGGGFGSLPFTCDSVDAEFDSIMYSCVHCVYM